MKRKLCALLLALGMIVSFAAAAGAAAFADVPGGSWYAAGRNGADGRLFVGRKRVDIRQLPVVDGLQGLRRALCQQIGKRSAAERAGEGRFILRAVGRQKGVRLCVGERGRVPGFFFVRRRDALAGVLRVQTRGDRDGLRPAD